MRLLTNIIFHANFHPLKSFEIFVEHRYSGVVVGWCCSKETLFVFYDARRTPSKKSPSNSMRKMRLPERWCEHTVDLCPERLLLQSTLWRSRDEYDAAELGEAWMLLLLLREHSRDAALQQRWVHCSRFWREMDAAAEYMLWMLLLLICTMPFKVYPWWVWFYCWVEHESRE